MTKYCTLPGQTPVRLDSTDGHIIIIGETPRPIPEQFVLKAKAAGCLTEDELAALTLRLQGKPAQPVGHLTDKSENQSTLLKNLDSHSDNFPDPPGSGSGKPAGSTGSDERAEQILAAVIELLNSGNSADLTSTGAPKVEALKDKLGFEVTAPERDAAYDAAKG